MSDGLSQLSTEQLQQKLRSTQTFQRTVLAIFAVIVAAWVVLGFWRTNPPVFITTLAMAVAVGAGVSVAPRAIRAELVKRSGA